MAIVHEERNPLVARLRSGVGEEPHQTCRPPAVLVYDWEGTRWVGKPAR